MYNRRHNTIYKITAGSYCRCSTGNIRDYQLLFGLEFYYNHLYLTFSFYIRRDNKIMNKARIKKIVLSSAIIPLSVTLLVACSGVGSSTTTTNSSTNKAMMPASKFDLSHWKITLPEDLDNDGKIDEISVEDIQNYAHPDFFYLDENGGMVFVAPNKAITSAYLQSHPS
ncbi:hypothetical protein GARC_3404 [Paraglaciecola arctica BSs20135]|uniref:Alginate lyase 2 domain-containing protein n=1 Tax=Paraglaciecola arctica BSs20135 TaxID=493475 RepID=K6YQC7_9ALTE|nr:hypothetical protein GARC_3404 [Paraglaciecola arctica BSs20135]